MKDAAKVWDKECETALDDLLQRLRESFITDAEAYADFMKTDHVDFRGLEVALFKTITTMNETNKAVIIKKMGPDQGYNIIHNFEARASEDVSLAIMDELMEKYDELPEEIQKLIDELKKRGNHNKEP